MNQRMLSALTPSVLAAMMGLVACGGGSDAGTGGGAGAGTAGGKVSCAGPADPNSGRVACPDGSPDVATALPTLTAFRSIATGNGKSVKWLGGIQGQQIARDGTPTGGVLALWTAGFCLGGTGPGDLGDALNLSTNGKECLALDSCQALDCSKSEDYPFPNVDVDAAITAAFPSDPAGTTYHLEYTAAVADVWKVGSSATSTTVSVDATTGTVMP